VPSLPRQIFDRLAASPGRVLVMRHEFGRVPTHWHDYYEFVYVTGGHGTHHCNGQDEEISTGTAILLGPTDFHGYSCPAGSTIQCYNLAIDPYFLEGHLAGLASEHQWSGVWTTSDLSDSAALLDQIWTESTSALPGSTQLVESLLLCVLIKLARLQPATEEPARKPDPNLRQALYYVERHFREPLTLAQVAERAHLSANHFSERFHAVTGTTFQTYLQQRRLRFARSLLRSSELSVAEAARAAGLQDPSHFARAYRQLFGSPPSIDRREAVG
jgi:AraC-like DNA-binding protein/mannose-6-phosphate isomerase-like protein (cupin superfamily)